MAIVKGSKELLFETPHTENLVETNLDEQIENAMLDYGAYIIENRSIPSMLDGLKVSQRRTIYTFKHLGIVGKNVKLARISGTTIAEFHPHGDTSINDAVANMSQCWKNNFSFFETQGNWGSIGGDNPAAARYVEIKLDKTSEEFLFENLNKGKKVVPWNLNYDDRLEEPTLLPVKYPFHLINGSIGIAYALATKIPSYNIVELTKMFIYMIENKFWKDSWKLDEHKSAIMDIVQGPDLPTYCDIIFKTEQEKEKSIFDGKFSFSMRSNFYLDDKKKAITISNIPYNVTTESIKGQILELMQEFSIKREGRKEEKIKKQDNEILNLQASTPIDITIDSDDNAKVQIVLKFKASADLNVEMVKLLNHTSLQETFSSNITTINQYGVPEQHSLYRNVRNFLYFRRHVIYQKTLFELEQLERHIHLLKGLMIVLNDKDRFLKILTEEDDYKEKILKEFTLLDEEQLNYILELKISKLSKLSVSKIIEEIESIEKDILEKKTLIENSDNLFEFIKNDYQTILDTNKKVKNSVRKSKIYVSATKTSIEDMIKNIDIILMLMNDDTIGYIEKSKFQAKNRGTQLKDSKLANNGFDINVKTIFDGMLKDEAYFITDKGRVFYEKLWKFSKKLLNVRNYFKLLPDENVIKIVNKNDTENNHLLLTTKTLIKNIALEMFKNVTSNSGKIAIKIKEDDLITNVIVHNNEKNEFVVLLSEDGKVIKFEKDEVKVSLGNNASGTRAINKNYVVKDMFLVDKEIENDLYILIVSNTGKGKKVDVTDINLKKIKQSPLVVFENNENNGKLLKGIILNKNENEEVVLVDNIGRINVIKISDALRSVSRGAKGSIKLINNNDNAKIVFASKNEVVKEDETLKNDNDGVLEETNEDGENTETINVSETVVEEN